MKIFECLFYVAGFVLVVVFEVMLVASFFGKVDV